MDALVADRTCAGLALIRLFVAMDGVSSQLRRRLDVGPNERLAIEYLWEVGPMAMSELADRLAVTRAAVTTLVDRLEEDGFLERTSDMLDRRRTIVTLSDHGRDRCDEVMASWMARIRSVLDQLSDEHWAIVGRVVADLHRVTLQECDQQRGVARPGD